MQQIQKLKKNIAEDFFENKGVRGKLKISQVMQAAMVTGQMLIMHQRAKANHTTCCSQSQSNSIFQAPPPKKLNFTIIFAYIEAVHIKDSKFKNTFKY